MSERLKEQAKELGVPRSKLVETLFNAGLEEFKKKVGA